MSRLQRLTDDYAKLLAENATLRLTGNENAVNCDAHTIPIAFISANGPCPACELQAKLDSAMAVVDALAKAMALLREMDSYASNRWEDTIDRLEKGDD